MDAHTHKLLHIHTQKEESISTQQGEPLLVRQPQKRQQRHLSHGTQHEPRELRRAAAIIKCNMCDKKQNNPSISLNENSEIGDGAGDGRSRWRNKRKSSEEYEQMLGRYDAPDKREQ